MKKTVPLAFGDENKVVHGLVNTSVVIGQNTYSGVQKKTSNLSPVVIPAPSTGATIVTNQLESYDHEVCLICYFDTHLAPI